MGIKKVLQYRRGSKKEKLIIIIEHAKTSGNYEQIAIVSSTQ